jgi:hypothetical protein
MRKLEHREQNSYGRCHERHTTDLLVLFRNFTGWQSDERLHSSPHFAEQESKMAGLICVMRSQIEVAFRCRICRQQPCPRGGADLETGYGFQDNSSQFKVI